MIMNVVELQWIKYEKLYNIIKEEKSEINFILIGNHYYSYDNIFQGLNTFAQILNKSTRELKKVILPTCELLNDKPQRLSTLLPQCIELFGDESQFFDVLKINDHIFKTKDIVFLKTKMIELCDYFKIDKEEVISLIKKSPYYLKTSIDRINERFLKICDKQKISFDECKEFILYNPKMIIAFQDLFAYFYKMYLNQKTDDTSKNQENYKKEETQMPPFELNLESSSFLTSLRSYFYGLGIKIALLNSNNQEIIYNLGDKYDELKKNYYIGNIKFVLKKVFDENVLKDSCGEIKSDDDIYSLDRAQRKVGFFGNVYYEDVKDYSCDCGKFNSERYKGVICFKCNTECRYKGKKNERIRYIKLALQIRHPLFNDLYINYLPVLPSIFRPIGIRYLSYNIINSRDLINHEYAVIIRSNKRLKMFIDQKAPESMILHEKKIFK